MKKYIWLCVAVAMTLFGAWVLWFKRALLSSPDHAGVYIFCAIGLVVGVALVYSVAISRLLRKEKR